MDGYKGSAGALGIWDIHTLGGWGGKAMVDISPEELVNMLEDIKASVLFYVEENEEVATVAARAAVQALTEAGAIEFSD